MNNLIYRSGHLQNIITVDHLSLERAEILFGPSSTLYGSDALGGVIHLFTKKPQFANDSSLLTKTIVQTRYSTVNNELAASADINIGGKRLASRTVVSYAQFGDLQSGRNENPFYKENYGTRDYYIERINGRDSIVGNSNRYLQVGSGYRQHNVLQKLAFKQNERVTHQINLQYSGSSDVPRYDRLTDVSGGILKFSEWYYGPQKRLLAAYDLNIYVDRFFQKKHVGLNYQLIEESRHQRKLNSDGLQSRIEDVGVGGINIDLQHKDDKHELQVGFDTQHNMLQSTANEKNIVTGEISPLDTRYPDGDNSMLSAAVYASHIWKINSNWNMTDGLRFGYASLKSTLSDTTFFKFPFTTIHQKNPVYSGSIGLVHHPADDFKMSFLVSSGFRVPNIDDLSKIFESAGGILIVPNPNIKPEKTVNAEWGMSKIIHQRTRLESCIYYTSFFDAIQTAPFIYNNQDSITYNGTLSAVMAGQNVGEAYLYGFSGTLKTLASNDFSFNLSMNYTYGRLKTDSVEVPLDHISPFMAKAMAAYSGKKFNTEFFVLYNGWKRLKDYSSSGEDNLVYATSSGMPAWLTANWRIGYTGSDHLTVQAGIENIFDTQYRVFASGMNAPGRNFYLTIRYSL